MPQKKPTTITITNFAGRLTRYQTGQLDSGFAKFDTSWGYDPFSKPGDLTWLYKPSDIGGSVVADAVLSGKMATNDSTARFIYAIGNAGRLYEIDPTQSETTTTPLNDTASVIAVISSVSGTFQYGGDIEYYNGKLAISSDSNVVTVNLDGSAIASVTGSSSITGALYHPQVQFLGNLYVGNGNNLVEISAGVVTNGAKLSPALPTGTYISDLDVTPDGTFMIITASALYPVNISSPGGSSDRGNPYAADSTIYYWNGIDDGITSYETLPSFPATALNTFLDKRFSFIQDAFGTSIYEGKQKMLTLPNNMVPMADGSAPNGTFLSWVAPEGTGTVSSSSTSYDNTWASLYYYGSLDAENPTGLWRLLRQAPQASNHIWRTPMNLMVNNFSFSRQTVIGWGKHYFSTFEYNSGAQTNTYKLYRFVLPPAANTNPVLGVFETQNQLFSKKIKISQIRVYTEPTAANNGFQLDIIGGDGAVVSNGTFTYTFVSGSDTEKLQGSLERINFNPSIATLYSAGLRITNTGTVNMTILKIEVDYTEEGK